jgi:TolB-like protein/Tfp pilus assembly protein PilF
MASDPHPPAPGGPLTLFLSYSRPDRAVAQRLADALHKAGHVVWWDALIEGGAKFASSIRAALDSAEVVIVLWSESAIDSDWVRDEAAQGRDRHRLVPLSIDGSQPPLGFRQYQVIDFARWNGHAGAPEFAAMLRAIALAAGHEAGPATPLPIARPGPRSSRRQLLVGVGAGTLVAGTGAVVAWRNFAAPAPAAARGIAVLPFKNLSGDPEQDYFAAGLTEEVRAALAANDAFQVVAATSSNVAHEGADSATKMARNLGVAYLLDGSVQLSRDIVRIAASLTDGKTGFTRWSQSIDRKLNDIFAVQNEIARTVSAALQVRMATDRPAPGGTRNLGAYENFLRGRALYNQAKDEATDRAALAHFDLAIAADDHFAMAYAARSRSLASIAAEYAKAEELKPLYASSIAAARRAIELAPDLAEANLALGYVLFTGKLDVAGARPFYDRAYALGRGNADIILLFALYCSRAGRAAEARSAVGRAIALDPLNPRTHRAAGSIDYAARRYEEALAPLARAVQLNPDITNARSHQGNCLMQLGRLDEARAAFAAEPSAMFRLTGLAIVEHRRGDDAAANKYLAQLVADVGDSALYQQAEVLAQFGRPADAVAALGRARVIGDSGLIYLRTDPLLDPIRKEPGFIKLLHSLNLG